MFGWLRRLFYHGTPYPVSEILVPVDFDGRTFMVQLEVAAEMADMERRINEAADRALNYAYKFALLAGTYGKPIAWFEADESARGSDMREVMWGFIHSTAWHKTKPDTKNPVWEIYGREL